MKGFAEALSSLVAKANPRTIHMIGCVKGCGALAWNEQGIDARGSDFYAKVIELALEKAKNQGVSPPVFTYRSIYDTECRQDNADPVMCCEVLECLVKSKDGLAALQRVESDYVIVSVPREPIWCAFNFSRGNYLTCFGNSPGYILQWSAGKIIDLVGRYFDSVEIKPLLPRTMLLCRVKH